jgi:TRAP-type transport system periplasmic protein
MTHPFRSFARLATLGTALVLAGGAQADDVTLRFSTAGPGADFLAKAMDSFAAEVASAEVGVTVETYPGSSLIRQGAEVPALQRGNLEMSTMSTFEIAAQVPAMGFLNRAFLFKDYDQMMEVMQGPFGETLHDAVAKDMDIEILATAYLGSRELNLRDVHAVTGPDDLAGVRMRMPASPEWLLLGESLGVSPTPLPMSETYVALQTGSVDGQENPLSILKAAKFDEVTKQVIMTNHLVQPVFFAMAKPVWDAMSADQQKVVKAAALTAAAQNNDARSADEAKVVDALRAEGIQVDTPDLTPFFQKADAVYAASDLAQQWDQDLMHQVMGD